jgi:hypothetical protein
MYDTQYSVQERIGAVILFFITSISLFCTCLNLYLIHDLNIWNGHMILVFILTIFQLLYDISFYFLLGFTSTVCFSIYKFFNVFSGTFISLWINFISYILYYTIKEVESFDIKRHYFKVFILLGIISLCLAVVLVVFYEEDTSNHNVEFLYYWLRIGSIGFNLLIYLVTTFQLYEKHFQTLECYEFCCLSIKDVKTDVRSKAADLLLILSARLKYYPLVQIVSLAGAAWWEFRYGFTPASFDNTNFSDSKEASFYLFVFFTPIAGIGYFIVFLCVQPLVYERFCQIRKKFLLRFHLYHFFSSFLIWCCGLDYSTDAKTGRQSDDRLRMESVDALTKDLFNVASQRPTEAGSAADQYLPRPVVPSFSKDFDMDEFRNKFQASVKNIPVELDGDNSQEFKNDLFDSETVNPLSASPKMGIKELLRTVNSSKVSSIDRTLSSNGRSSQTENTGITSPYVSRASDGPLFRFSDTSRRQTFTIDNTRHSYQAKLQSFPEEMLWEELEKLKKTGDGTSYGNNKV